MAEEEIFIKKEVIKTMKKDIAALQSQGGGDVFVVKNTPSTPSTLAKTQVSDEQKNKIARLEAERIKKEEERKQKEGVERKRREEQELKRKEIEAKRSDMLAKMRAAEEERKKIEEERRRTEEEKWRLQIEEQNKKEQEKRRNEDEKKRSKLLETQKRAEEERLKKEEWGKKRMAEDENKKIEREKKIVEEEKKRLEMEKQRMEEAERRKKEEESRRIKEEEERKKKEEEEKIRIEEEKRKQEEEEKRKREEEEKKRKIEEEIRKKQEEERNDLLDIAEIRKKARELAVKEKILQEEREKKEKSKTAKEKLLENLNLARKEEIEARRMFPQIEDRKKVFEIQKNSVLEKMKAIEKDFKAIAEKEEKIEESERLVEEKISKTEDLQKRKKLEKERQSAADARKQLEEKRWPFDEQIIGFENQIKDIDVKIQELEIEEDKLKEKERQSREKGERTQKEIEKGDLTEELQKIDQLRQFLDAKKVEVSSEIGKLEENLKPILARETDARNEKSAIEKQEKETKNLGERRKLEKERWQIEEKIRKVEEERWAEEDKKQDLNGQMKRIVSRMEFTLERKEEINKKIAEINEKFNLGQTLGQAQQQIPKKPVLEKLPTEKIVAKEKVKDEEVSQKIVAPKIEKTEEAAAEKQAVAPLSAPAEKPGITPEEQKRLEEARKRIEALKKQQGEPVVEGVGIGIRINNPAAQTGNQNIPAEPPVIAPEAKKIISYGYNGRPISAPNGIPNIPAEPFTAPLNEPNKKEFAPAPEKQKEFAAPAGQRGFVPEQKISSQNQPVSVFPSSPLSRQPAPFIKVIPQRPPSRKKFWVRIIFTAVVVLIVVSILTFWYWFFMVKNSANNSNGPSQTAVHDSQIYFGDPVKLGISPSAPLLNVQNNATITISDSSQVISLVSKVLGSLSGDQQFTRIIIKNKSDNKILGMKEVLTDLKVKATDDFYKKVDDDFTFFAYAQKNGGRLGFITKIKDNQGLLQYMKNWEDTIESDFNVFSSLMTGERAGIPYFLDSSAAGSYKGPNFRYKVGGSDDIGICYLPLNGYFIFTASFESMEKAIAGLSKS